MIIVITGPTGIGKTKLSIELAKKYQAIIINGDSMQVYQGLDIGTSKIKENEKEGIPHYLFDIVNLNQNYTVYDYQKDIRKLLDKYQHRNLIIVGGSGLYIKAALYDYRFNEEKVSNDFNNLTNEELFKLAKEKYPEIEIHLNNRQRLVRLLNKKGKKDNYGNNKIYDSIFIGLTTDREKLYEIINNRVDKMIADGLIEEARNFYQEGIYSKAIMTGIGYKELYQYFEGKSSLEESIALIKKNSRHYAKRQYTWFKNQLDITWFKVNLNNFSVTVEAVIKYIDRVNKNC